MENKTCGECRFFVENEGHGGCCTFMCDAMCNDDRACANFARPTNGDRIRQGGNIELFIFWYRNQCSVCAFDGKDNCPQVSCADGLMEWLNAPADDCVKQNGNHDTQTDLCKADNTESEVEDE